MPGKRHDHHRRSHPDAAQQPKQTSCRVQASKAATSKHNFQHTHDHDMSRMAAG